MMCMKCCAMFLLYTFAVFSTVQSYAEQTALDKFIESCRGCGENVNLIQSGSATFDCVVNQRFPDTFAQSLLGKMQARMNTDSAKLPAHVTQMNLEGLQKMKQVFENKERVRYRYNLLFIGNDVFFNLNTGCKRYRMVEQYDEEQKIWQLGEYAIMAGSPNAGSMFADFIPGAKTASVEGKMKLGYEFQRFGRMQKSSAYYTMLQCMGEDRKKFQITDKAIQAFKEKMKEKNYSFEIAGTAAYDDNRTATILEIKTEGRVVERFWIDPSRGYICPLIQCFDEKGNVEIEYKSSGYFLHEKTGLWYPENYEETLSIPFPTKNVYTLNKETFQLNHAVSDEMFTLDIPERTKVVDKRNSTEEMKYTAMDKGVLSLKKGGLDLKKMKWLMREGDLTYGKEEPFPAFRRVRYISMTVGALLIFYALFMKYRQWKTKL